MENTSRQALFVYGGWSGHQPEVSAQILIPLLEARGFDVTSEETLEVYSDPDYLRTHDVIIHNWSMGEILGDELAGLLSAVKSGVGLAGWHGGFIDSFRMATEFMHMVGGQFAAHPHDFVDYSVTIQSDHEVVAGVADFCVHSEQYWVLTDPLSQVHATTTIPVRDGDPWNVPVTSPVVWTRQWGRGRVFASTLGHNPHDLTIAPIQRILLQGISWAAEKPSDN